jgi:hypothetical protein
VLLVAAALSARDRAVALFNRGSHHAAALSWADGDAAWTNADGGVIAPTIPIVAIGAVPPDLNIDALRHLEALGLGRSGRRSAPAATAARTKVNIRMPPARVIAGPRALLSFYTFCLLRGCPVGGRGLAGEPSHTNNAWRR